MVFQSMLGDLINDTFEKQVGKHQLRAEAPSAFRVSFSMPTDYDKEEGYRGLEVVFWGPMNYVQVWVRETWDVIPVDDLEFDDDGDSRPKKGKKYTKGSTEWRKVADHDSCWRDGIDRVLKEYESRIRGFNGPGCWQKVPAANFPFTAASR